MGKWQHGPGMLDCLVYLAQMDEQGDWFTTIVLIPTGSPNAPHVTFNLLSSKSKQVVLDKPGIITVYDGYPSREHSTFNAAFYRALVEHDTRLSSEQFLDGLT